MDKVGEHPAAASEDFAGLIERHQWALWAFLRGFVGDEPARDLTQDVFCDAWRVAGAAQAHPIAQGPSPLSQVNQCLGTTLLGVSNVTAQWKANGNAINSCSVGMSHATLTWASQLICPLGEPLDGGDIAMTPPVWPSGYGIAWNIVLAAECFDCTDGIMTETPAYQVKVSVSLKGTGTNKVAYVSAPPDVSITIPIKQFPLGTPC